MRIFIHQPMIRRISHNVIRSYLTMAYIHAYSWANILKTATLQYN